MRSLSLTNNGSHSLIICFCFGTFVLSKDTFISLSMRYPGVLIFINSGKRNNGLEPVVKARYSNGLT